MTGRPYLVSTHVLDDVIGYDGRKVTWCFVRLVGYMHSASVAQRIVPGRVIKLDVDVLNTVHARS